jgi:predicted nuclease of restriction endonuclease-like (RecB) superfamily
MLYWEIGRDILARQQQQGWGSKVVDRQAADLRSAFPDMKGLSRANLMYMRSFAAAWPHATFVQAVLGQLPWYHQIALLDKLGTAEQREWYARSAIEHGWSRNVLVHQIETDLFNRQGAALTNFKDTLPPEQSELAQQLTKTRTSSTSLTLASREDLPGACSTFSHSWQQVKVRVRNCRLAWRKAHELQFRRFESPRSEARNSLIHKRPLGSGIGATVSRGCRLRAQAALQDRLAPPTFRPGPPPGGSAPRCRTAWRCEPGSLPGAPACDPRRGRTRSVQAQECAGIGLRSTAAAA